MSTLIHRRVESARRGENPAVICKMPSGWAVIGDVQMLPGYCLLLPDPVPASLNDMEPAASALFLRDMTIIGDALLEVTDAFRINYEILGNSEPALHAHILPRYNSEPEALRCRPAWFYDWKTARPFDPQTDGPLVEALAATIRRRLEQEPTA